MASGVGVIVATFNRSQLLRTCIESLLDQTVSADCIVVVDDGSSDDTAAVVASFGERVSYVHKSNGGKARAVNLALQQIRTPWVWLFDDDDIALPNAIADRLAALAATPGAEWVYAPHQVGIDDGHGGVSSRRQQEMTHPGPEGLLLKLMSSCYFHLNSCLIHRSVYAAAGTFDPEQKAGEDYDMQIRIAATSSRSAFSPRPVFVFRQHRGVRGEQQARYAESERERVFMRYSQRLAEKVRATMPMDAYLVPRRPVATAEDEGQALFGRAAVMGNLGSWRGVLEDLEASLKLSRIHVGLTGKELHSVRLLFGNGWMLNSATEEWPEFLEGVSRLHSLDGGSALRRALAAGIWDVARGYEATWTTRLARLRQAWQLARA